MHWVWWYSEAVSVKGFQLQPLGEQGELAQGREAAFNHPF